MKSILRTDSEKNSNLSSGHFLNKYETDMDSFTSATVKPHPRSSSRQTPLLAKRLKKFSIYYRNRRLITIFTISSQFNSDNIFKSGISCFHGSEMNNSFIWDIASRSLVKVDKCFRQMYCVRRQD